MLEPAFHNAGAEVVDIAASFAAEAFKSFRNSTGAVRAKLLRNIADRLDNAKSEIVARAHHESGLPEARLNGEMGRTTGQLRMFATIAEDENWLDLRVDEALPDRQPLPRPSLKSYLRPIGPVLVFGASNFPLAFSVAGGDTASALAAGCPVIVKSHHAHAGTGELVAQQIVAAIEEEGLPVGVFALVVGEGAVVGQALVAHPVIQGVGFTGSRRGGLALVATAQARPQPIPVYAEMSSINPVVVLPSKLASDPDGFATGLAGSVTLGVGQFCTNPGLVLVVGEPGAADFESKLTDALAASAVGTMLTDGIGTAYVSGATGLASQEGVETLVRPMAAGGAGLFKTDSSTFIANPELQAEVFGPSTLLVSCPTIETAIEVIESLEGQLTGSIFADPSDLDSIRTVADALEQKVGRIIFNQFPTGVEVCNSMIHGGPFPSTSDPRSTSVGGRAIERWARPVAYQNWPL